MATLFNRLLSPFRRSKDPESPAPRSKRPRGMSGTPITPGRETRPDVGALPVGRNHTELKPEIPLEFIPLMEHLAAFNADFSFAVDNVVQLASTDHTIEYADSVPDDKARAMNLHLMERRNGWYANSSGMNSLVNDLLFQVVVTGTLSAEIVPEPGLRGVKEVVKVNPHNIRFFWESENETVHPYQKPTTGWTGAANNNGGWLRLNTETYVYMAQRRMRESPYGVPPFLTAIEGLGTQKEMLENFGHIMRKMGTLGFLQVLMEMPEWNPDDSETQEQYRARAISYLKEQVKLAEEQRNKGIVGGFKDETEFTLVSPSGNAAGADKLFRVINQNLHSGLKQDGAMLGRDSTVSETFGRVILAKMASQAENFQEIVAAFLGRLYLLELELAGFAPGFVNVKFERSMIGDQLREAQTESISIQNGISLYNQGIISQDQLAQRLGYEQAAETAPVRSQPLLPMPGSGEGEDEPGDEPGGSTSDEPGAGEGGEEDDDETDPTDEGTTGYGRAWERAALDLGMAAPEYPYGVPAGCLPTEQTMASWDDDFDMRDWRDEKLQRLLGEYRRTIRGSYRDATRNTAKGIVERLLAMPAGATLDEVIDAFFAEIYLNWGSNFSQKARQQVSRYAERIYTFFRKDTRVFEGLDGFEIPDALFNRTDTRAYTFFENVDSFYLGKFITDQDTRNRLTAWLRQEYLNGSTPIGRNTAAATKFREAAGDNMNAEDWKIRRIIDTSVNRMRSYGHMNYLDQAQIKRFRIVGVPDSNQCEYCRNLGGKVFSIEAAVQRMKTTLEAPPEQVPQVNPFATQVRPDPAGMLAPAEELQAAGIDAPPFHPHCRDRIVAVL